MKRIVVAAKAGADQPWLADAAADLAEEMDAEVAVVSLDGIELEALSTVPRSELARDAQAAAAQAADRIRQRGIDATAESRSGPVVRGVLVFAEERDADLIVVGATTRGPVARRMLGTITTRLVERSRRPVLVITPPPAA
jgi:nucleotide-binding universal stress UspA family protein